MCKVMPQEQGITEIGITELRSLRSSFLYINSLRPSLRLSFTYLLLLSIPGPFFLVPSFFFFFTVFLSYAASFSLTSFHFHYVCGSLPIGSVTLHFVTHFFSLQSVYVPCLLPIGVYDEYGANRMAPWVFFPPREKGKKRVK
jgi:hypothetical protein